MPWGRDPKSSPWSCGGESSPSNEWVACALLFIEGHPTNSTITTPWLLPCPHAPSPSRARRKTLAGCCAPSLFIHGERLHCLALHLSFWNLNLRGQMSVLQTCAAAFLMACFTEIAAVSGTPRSGTLVSIGGSALFAQKRAYRNWKVPS